MLQSEADWSTHGGSSRNSMGNVWTPKSWCHPIPVIIVVLVTLVFSVGLSQLQATGTGTQKITLAIVSIGIVSLFGGNYCF